MTTLLASLNESFDKKEKAKPVELLKTANLGLAVKRAGDAAPAMKHTFKHGKKRGDTTHIKPLNLHLSWKPGFLYCITGWPQHGKTEFTQFLAVIKSVLDGKKWACYSPENYPEDEFFDSLAHLFVGKSTDPKSANQMTEREYDQAIEFLHEHFFYVYQEGKAHTPEFVREVYAFIQAKYGLYGTITDPWNKLAHLRKGASIDDYLAEQLPKEQQQGRELDLVRIICAHPRTPKDLEKGKPLPVPDQYSLHGGQMWDNMCDYIGAVYRPNYHIDKTDTATEFYAHKIKKQRLVGIPGKVDFEYDRPKGRYYRDGSCPLDATIVKPQPQLNKLPQSTFEEVQPPF